MRKAFGGALVAMLLTFAGTGNATTFTDTYTPPGGYYFLNNYGETFTFYHDITDNGFLPASYTITSADIDLKFYDDNSFDSAENVSFTFDGSGYGTQEIDTGTIHFLINPQLLQNDGKVEVKLTSISGDVYFEKSTLTAQATPTATPEPGSLLLLGSGLSGLGFIGRRRFRASQEQA